MELSSKEERESNGTNTSKTNGSFEVQFSAALASLGGTTYRGM